MDIELFYQHWYSMPLGIKEILLSTTTADFGPNTSPIASFKVIPNPRFLFCLFNYFPFP